MCQRCGGACVEPEDKHASRAFHCEGCGQSGLIRAHEVHTCPPEPPAPPSLEERKVVALETIAAALVRGHVPNDEHPGLIWEALATLIGRRP
jgi:hypothetical protein